MCPNDNELHLVYASDANYALYLEVAIRAAYFRASRPEDLMVHVLDCGIPDEQWTAFAQRIETAEPAAQLVRHIIDMAQFDGLPTWNNGSRAIYARLCLPSILNNIEWCVYADVDTLFIDNPLELLSLYDPAIGLQGPFDQVAPTRAWRWYERNKIPLSREDYLCSGFLIINLTWFREHDMERRALHFLSDHTDLPFPDQDMLNILCAGSKRLLPKGWGAFAAQAFGVKELKCIHFAGVGELPWKVSFSWKRGYRESMLIWYQCAKTLLGVSRYEVSKVPGWRWWIGLTYTRMIKYTVRLFALFPGTASIQRFYEGRFPSRKHAYLFRPNFWHR